jgi:hypothetical protein
MTDSRLVFYYRDGCHLCEELASLLHRGWPMILDKLEWVDVDRSPAARESYGLRIPVLEQGGRVLCELKPDPQCLREHFGPPVNPV